VPPSNDIRSRSTHRGVAFGMRSLTVSRSSAVTWRMTRAVGMRLSRDGYARIVSLLWC